MHPKQLEEKLREVMAQSSRGMSEKVALEAAMNVADEWKMRLEEIEDEDTDSEDEE